MGFIPNMIRIAILDIKENESGNICLKENYVVLALFWGEVDMP